MPSSVTVTAKAGPGLQATALVLSNISNIMFDMDNRKVQVNNSGTVIREFDLVGVTTITFSLSGANYTITVS